MSVSKKTTDCLLLRVLLFTLFARLAVDLETALAFDDPERVDIRVLKPF